MKTLLIILFVILLSSVCLLFIFGKYSQKSHAPGILNGSLSKCSNKPNCVCSEYIEDAKHYIMPINHPNGHADIDMTMVSATIQGMNGMIQSEQKGYIAATFTSKIFGFVDDMEFRSDLEHGVLHMRSASRVGYSDGGVNQKRVEAFKKLYSKKLEENK